MLPVVDFTQSQKMVLALGNAGPDDLAWSVNVGDERLGQIGSPSDQAKEAILIADEGIILAGLAAEGWFGRPDFMDWSALLDHLTELPSHYGATGDVQILPWVGSTYVAGKPAS